MEWIINIVMAVERKLSEYLRGVLVYTYLYMSADTAIAIAKFPEWYRHTGIIQAIENLEPKRYGTRSKRRSAVVDYGWFGPHKEHSECYESAKKIADRCDDLEYGIVYVGEFPFRL